MGRRLIAGHAQSCLPGAGKERASGLSMRAHPEPKGWVVQLAVLLRRTNCQARLAAIEAPRSSPGEHAVTSPPTANPYRQQCPSALAASCTERSGHPQSQGGCLGQSEPSDHGYQNRRCLPAGVKLARAHEQARAIHQAGSLPHASCLGALLSAPQVVACKALGAGYLVRRDGAPPTIAYQANCNLHCYVHAKPVPWKLGQLSVHTQILYTPGQQRNHDPCAAHRAWSPL